MVHYIVGTRLPERRKRSIAKACMSTLCVCIRGYYNTTLESEDTHATNTVIKVLQSLEEHFIVVHMLLEPQQYMNW